VSSVKFIKIVHKSGGLKGDFVLAGCSEAHAQTV
jgi:hypothetical protein